MKKSNNTSINGELWITSITNTCDTESFQLDYYIYYLFIYLYFYACLLTYIKRKNNNKHRKENII